MARKGTHILGKTGKIFGWLIVIAIVLVAFFARIWILLGAALIMVLGLWAGEGSKAEDHGD